MIIVDSDVLIEIVDRKSEKGDKALELILKSGEKMFVTSVTLHEVLYGLRKRRKPAEDVISLPVLDFTRRDALLSSEVELEAERKGSPISRMDAMITAIAVNNEAKLYCFNTKHFSSLKALGLKLFP